MASSMVCWIQRPFWNMCSGLALPYRQMLEMTFESLVDRL